MPRPEAGNGDARRGDGVTSSVLFLLRPGSKSDSDSRFIYSGSQISSFCRYAASGPLNGTHWVMRFWVIGMVVSLLFDDSDHHRLSHAT